MHLTFERGTAEKPAGHALVYFQNGAEGVFASYIVVPPVSFDPAEFTPPALAPLLQGLDLGSIAMAAPMPPLPQKVSSVDYLRALAERRGDDLLFGGSMVVSSPIMLVPELAEAANQYGAMYRSSTLPSEAELIESPRRESRFVGMSEAERINELTALTGRLRDSMRGGRADFEILDEMGDLVDGLPPKYRGSQIIRAAQEPGEHGQRLVGLYLDRCYRLLQEDYLDLERIDREIESLAH